LLREKARDRDSKYRGIDPYTAQDDEEYIQFLLSSPIADKAVYRRNIERDRKELFNTLRDDPILQGPDVSCHPRYPHVVQLRTRLRRYQAALERWDIATYPPTPSNTELPPVRTDTITTAPGEMHKTELRLPGT